MYIPQLERAFPAHEFRALVSFLASVCQIPLDRLASPKDSANLIAFLLSDEAAYITGQIINVDGGLSLI